MDARTGMSQCPRGTGDSLVIRFGPPRSFLSSAHQPYLGWSPLNGKKISLKCLCGKDVIGFTRKHAEANLAIHQRTSGFHKDVLAAVKRLRGKRL